MVDKDVGYLIKSINDKLKVKADTDLKNHNLTLSQSRVLIFLYHNGGQATQKEIEIFLEVSHPTVVGIVSRMEHAGHVTCWIDETDRRNKIVRLTDSAKAISVNMEQNITSNERRMLASLSDEDILSLRRMLGIIYQNLEEIHFDTFTKCNPSCK